MNKATKISLGVIVFVVASMLALALYDYKDQKGIIFEEPVLGYAPEHALKTDKTNIVGNRTNGDVVTYAYKTENSVSSTPGSLVDQIAQEDGLTVTYEATSKRTKHARTFETESGKFITEFISGSPQYYKDSSGDWWDADYATTTVSAYGEQTKRKLKDRFVEITRAFFFGQPVLATESTFFPDANAEDGRAAEGTDSDWATIQSAAGDFSSDADTVVIINAIQTAPSNEWSNITRGIFMFDTSAIPDTDVISSATLSLHGAGQSDGANINPAWNVYSSNPASTSSIANTDYSTLGSTDFSTEISEGAFNTSDYNDWVLNASGIANISKTEVSKFGLRESNYDAPDIEPSWTGSGLLTFIQTYMSEDTGTSRDPKLVVVHAAPVAAPVTGEVQPTFWEE